jgi:outer membrane protein OmpA-like peptidoglycan-associated protein
MGFFGFTNFLNYLKWPALLAPLFFPLSINAQTKISSGQTEKIVKCDCDSAIALNIVPNFSYGPTLAPAGSGSTNEIHRTGNNPDVFEKEHNTAWYLLNISTSGELCLTITPKNPNDDYDFLIYRYFAPSTCDSISKGTIQPIRANLSRSQNINSGKSGLAPNEKSEYTGEGRGDAFSKAIPVKKGEKYLLVVDNVYGNGSGHTLTFFYLHEITINGNLTSESGKHLKGEIGLYDDSGKVVSEFKTDSSGKFSMKIKIMENKNYSLVETADSSFPVVTTINTRSADKTSAVNIKSILPDLKKGHGYKFSGIHFIGDAAIPLPVSIPSLNALYVMMKKNPNLKIQIEGHVNGVGVTKDTSYFQKISDDRAKYVYDYLIKRGINASRMSWIGFGDRNMLYPQAKTDIELELNRRVEINVIEY